jgi:hypothetical protein
MTDEEKEFLMILDIKNQLENLEEPKRRVFTKMNLLCITGIVCCWVYFAATIIYMGDSLHDILSPRELARD